MENLSVGLGDYKVQSEGAFGSELNSPQQLEQLNKALEATELRGSDPAATSGAPLKVESLENTLKILTHRITDIEFWKRIPKLPAYNTVEEYNQLGSYGTDRGGAYNEGELPEEEDSEYTRQAQLVKYYGVTKSVTHPMQLVNTMIGNVVQREVKNGVLWVLRKVDKSLFFGNEDIVTQEFNGYYKQQFDGMGLTLDQYTDSEVVIDLRGKALDEDQFEEGALGIIENFGYPDLFMAPPIVLSNFVKRFYGNKWIQPNTVAVTEGVMGQRVKTFASQFGDLELGYDKFAKASPPRIAGSAALSPKAPGDITVNAIPAVVADATTRFTDGAGDYYYAVAPVNRYGEGKLVAMDTSVTAVLATQSVDLDFSDGGGTYPATGYIVYRSVVDPSGAIGDNNLYPIFSISKAELTAGYDGAAAGKVRDKNRFIANTDQALMIQNNDEVYSFKQLAPLMKMDLAILSPAYRFMILHYGTPQLYAPRKMARFINVGTDLT